MRNFPLLLTRQLTGVALMTAGLLPVVPVHLQGQSIPSLAMSSKTGAEESVRRGVENLPSIARISAGLETAFPPKPSWKEDRMRRAETLYAEGYRLYQSGDRLGARQHFDDAMDLILNSQSQPVNRSAFDKRFDELVQRIYRIDVDSLQTEVSDPAVPSYDKAPIDDILSLTFPVDPKLKLKVREEVGVTVSQLPLEASDAVLSFINYFSGDRGKRTLVAGLKRAGRYKPMISRILDEEGIPQEFIFLAQAESGFLPRAMSYMAAGGMWQFIRETGAKYGLKNDAWVDERFDPEMATRAAARHLRDLYHEFGDWYLAIAAYNCGQGNVDKAVAKTGYADVWELRSRGTLPLETSNYVPIILAMTIMAKNPSNYGIEDVTPEDPLVYDSITMNVPTNLALISDVIDRPVSELKELNPALLRDLAPAGYRLHIPRGSSQTLMAGLDMVPTDKRANWRAHRAGATDTMASLATRYGTSSAALAAANNIADNEVTEGSLIIIPAAAPRTTVRAAAKSASTVKSARSTSSVKTRTRAAKGKSSRTRTAATRVVPAKKAPSKTAAKPAGKGTVTAARGAGRRRQG